MLISSAFKADGMEIAFIPEKASATKVLSPLNIECPLNIARLNRGVYIDEENLCPLSAQKHISAVDDPSEW